MALKVFHKETEFGVGDAVRVWQKIQEGDKFRLQAFEGMVLGIKGRDIGATFTVRRIGTQRIGIERIFPVNAPTIEKIEVVRKGTEGVRQAKLYYTRTKSKRQIEDIYSRATSKNQPTKKAKPKKKSSKK